MHALQKCWSRSLMSFWLAFMQQLACGMVLTEEAIWMQLKSRAESMRSRYKPFHHHHQQQQHHRTETNSPLFR
ncbi:hypothetical protein QVD17_05931 [Tagetes erecta]|uniref:Secreted protein n=1 Tax=Tagetes erecta TaxID=13708 RepID=A0AAD8LJ78_TARER|nr:hypothetical protein QVD17_05931 [Tagetes erecta]